MMKAVIVASFVGVAQAKCCETCPDGQQKYYSVDMKHGHCGESCVKPSDFWKFKPFEANLTIADGSTGYTSCADLGWPKYTETVSHGVWPVRATLDLYDHNDLISDWFDKSLAVVDAAMSIVETAQATPQLSSLVGALVQADLVDALSGPGPFTVFAPTNDAFDAISSVVAGLTKEQLQQVLEYHVVSGAAVKSTDLTDMEVILPLFSGHSLGVDLEEGTVRIVGENNAVTVTTADVECTNGVVHIVDAVLVPKLGQDLAVVDPYMSIVETAQATPQLSSLVGALVQADLVDALSGRGPFTVFAPTNDAFDAISSVVAGLTKEQLQQVLEYHVVSGAAVKSTDLEVRLPLYSGHRLGVDLEEGTVRIVGENNAVTVTTADVECTNGIIHIVDAILVPKLGPMSIVETAQATPQLSSLVDAFAQFPSLVDALSGPGPFTVFAPTNDAFFPIWALLVVAGYSEEQLQQVLEYHVVSGAAVKSTDLTDMEVILPLFSGHSLGVDLEEGTVRIVGEASPGATVTTADVECTNGIIHIVDAILVPKFDWALTI